MAKPYTAAELRDKPIYRLYKTRLIATIDSQAREIMALRREIDATCSYDSGILLANRIRDEREGT